MTQERWVMPRWMEKYRPLIQTRDNRSVEDMMSDGEGDMNSPHYELRVRSMWNYAVAAQVNLLNDLRARSLLRDEED